jgi:hypothetical protein
MSNIKITSPNIVPQQIIIEDGNKRQMIDIPKIFTTFNQSFLNSSKYTFDNFKLLNSSINRGDCIKDGTNDATLTGLGLFMLTPDFNLNNVKTLAHHVIDNGKKDGKVIRQIFTRDKKGDETVKEHYAGMAFDIGFDSGLGLDNFLFDKQYDIVDTFGKYIDPSSFRDSNKHFPNGTLEITPDMFQRLGYENCALPNAKYMGKDKYDYQIILAEKELSNKTNGRSQDENIQTIFVGNKVKKGINDTLTKKAAIIGKSLGDKLQVFLMFIKKVCENETSKINCISTCDEIVLLFCIILDLPCFYTSIGIEKKIKINEILYFNSDNINAEKAKIRFEKEKQIVLQKYDELINTVNEFTKVESLDIYVSGGQSYIFPPFFYQAIIDDLKGLIEYINTIQIENSNDINDINQTIGKIKQLSVNQFIRKGKTGEFMLMYSSSKYTNANIPDFNQKANILALLGDDSLQKKYSKSSFFIIAEALSKNVKGGNWKGGNPKNELFEEFFHSDPIIVHVNSDECIDHIKCNHVVGINEFDANRQLYEEITEIYNKLGYNNKIIPVIDIYSELLCIFNYEPDYTTKRLTEFIQEKYNESKISTFILSPSQKQISLSHKTHKTQKQISLLHKKKQNRDSYLLKMNPNYLLKTRREKRIQQSNQKRSNTLNIHRSQSNPFTLLNHTRKRSRSPSSNRQTKKNRISH